MFINHCASQIIHRVHVWGIIISNNLSFIHQIGYNICINDNTYINETWRNIDIEYAINIVCE